MYTYKIRNSERLEKEIDNLLSFPLLKDQIKKKLVAAIILDAKENCDYVTPEKLFEEQEYGVWFHTTNYQEFRSGLDRYDTYIIYRCLLDDNREILWITVG